MDEKIIKSKKINLSNKFRIAWIAIAVLFVLITVLGVMQYATYKDAQEAAIEFTLATTDRFDAYKDDYTNLVNQMYNFYAPTYINTVINGVKVDNSDVVNAAKAAEAALDSKMYEAGYRQYTDAECFQYTSCIDFVFAKVGSIYSVWIVLVVILLLVILWYAADKKKTIEINGDRIICKKGTETVKEFLIKNVNGVKSAFMKGLVVSGNGIKHKIMLLENADEIKAAIMNSATFHPAVKNVNVAPATTIIQQTSNADELKKFKELLDSGVITQEEFDAKKKQLLGL